MGGNRKKLPNRRKEKGVKYMKKRMREDMAVKEMEGGERGG